MAPPDDNHIHQQIGSLTAKIDMLIEATRRSEEKSDVSRASMHRRMDEIVDRVAKVENSAISVQEDVKEMKPITDDVKRWKLMGIGALGVIGVAGMALGVSFADVLKRIATVLIGR
ncbi:DUF1515 family protein [Rhizobium sp. WW_1]|jgi:hypothetical protein|uniref:DUF1515 family protein n=1 Tax=Rhizobium sp. WW_1 TaxID=1907375 RepID=UPI000647A75B|nr:DUF1515 family protein [Rhizobium sp. WW_1]RKD68957.1 uncharacterized protein DUF1515 [Rhizobium sp. WW_1]